MSAGPIRLVRDEVFDRCRELGMSTIFSNPGSTEVPALAGLPGDFRFVLGLHEAAVVGMATGLALAGRRPALVMLHTTAGLGNAVSALATARENGAPLVVLVGQQDRRHLVSRPFLTGEIEGLAGNYPVWVTHPPRAQDLPSIVFQAWHHANTSKGPSLVVVPMDDWLAEAEDLPIAAPAEMVLARRADPEQLRGLERRLESSINPALVVGAAADSAESWKALVELAERLQCPVYQEAFGARSGFPQDHPLFAGHLPSGRAALRTTLSAHDAILCVGAPAFRQYPFEAGAFVNEGTWVGVLAEQAADAAFSAADVAVIAPIASACSLIAGALTQRRERQSAVGTPPKLPEFSSGGALYPQDVFAVLAERLPPETVLVEESPSSRSRLVAMLQTRAPLGFLSAAMGGLGFAVPGAIGVKMACPERPVVAVVGDGSSLYSIQALWSGARYRIGALIVVLCNRHYSIMDHLHRRATGSGEPLWPGFDEVDIAGLARSLGCASVRVDSLQGLREALPNDLVSMESPMVIAVDVENEPELVV